MPHPSPLAASAACVLALATSAWTGGSAIAATHHSTTRHTTSHHSQTHHRSAVCESYRRGHANRGTVTGAVAGGLLGNVVAGHGSRTEGTLIGAGVGAVAGHQIASNNAKHRCR